MGLVMCHGVVHLCSGGFPSVSRWLCMRISTSMMSTRMTTNLWRAIHVGWVGRETAGVPPALGAT